MALRYRTAAVVALVVTMVALAGCIGISDGTGTATPTTQTETSTPESTATSTPTPTPPSGELNVTEARIDTQATLEEAGSYTAVIVETTRSQYQSETQELTSNRTYRVNLEDNRTLAFAVTSGTSSAGTPNEFNSSIYTDGAISYTRLSNGNDTQYFAQNYSESGLTATQTPSVGTVQDPLLLVTMFDGWEAQELTTVNGVSVRRYTATDVAPQEDRSALTTANITDGSAALYIDAEGTIRSVEANYTRQFSVADASTETEVSYTLDGIGATTVEEPGWTSEAPAPEPVAPSPGSSSGSATGSDSASGSASSDSTTESE